MAGFPDGTLFVSLNPSAPVPVARWGTRALIAARRDPKDHRKIHYNLAEVVAIPAEEYRRFRSEYNDAIRSGDLVLRTETQFQASQKANEAAEQALHDEAKKRRAAREVPAPVPEVSTDEGDPEEGPPDDPDLIEE